MDLAAAKSHMLEWRIQMAMLRSYTLDHPLNLILVILDAKKLLNGLCMIIVYEHVIK